MSDLQITRDHARRLSTAEHRDDCRGATKPPPALLGMPRISRCAEVEPHTGHEFIDDFGIRWDCPGICAGCMPESDRALWARLADEIDDYLEPADEMAGDLTIPSMEDE